MITLQIDGACKDCPFMELIITELSWNNKQRVCCRHETYCDREAGETHVSEIPGRGKKTE